MLPSTPGRIRTCDLSFRKAALYPTELLGHQDRRWAACPDFNLCTCFVHLEKTSGFRGIRPQFRPHSGRLRAADSWSLWARSQVLA